MTKRLAIFLTLAWAIPVAAITIDTVPIGNVGNPNDPATGNLYGGVSYAYNIGKYEVTVGEYTAFLNAVAATDTYELYLPAMSDDIAQIGASGSYTYNVIGSANRTINYVTWGDAARFANWLNNGQPTGSQNASTTERGAYTLNGATSTTALYAVTRSANAKWFIPSENEWYKAAYYQPAVKGGDADSYWDYPMKTNGAPYSDQPPGTTPDNTRVGNFRQDDGSADGYDDGFAVTGSTAYDGSHTTTYLSDVGAYVSSPSYYGTFDQGGNVWEWNEAQITGSYRGIRGGSWHDAAKYLLASNPYFYQPAFISDILGFRVASTPLAVGDFNSDGKVDAADYLVWRDSNGSVADYNVWRANFGLGSSANGSGSAQSANVPEPSVPTMFAVGALSVAIFRRGQFSHARRSARWDGSRAAWSTSK